ncbi:hypothetical protein SAMN05216229_12366 [Geopseudomonas sagittaria]|uniref:Uncharacterized protein n=1 Tax=Geopseudomonas sagittaria TaxID=1135990 RepID=A0A1I5YRI4_9GAMM|nr:hypothetical protein [Pseudomonas sagittaria]SFQ46894.1 hypothetical protein SAMN05216229_12366 [Pseudomonas sagittaria]
MSTKTDDFTAWFEAPEQADLRLSCSRGWAELIWQASRAAVVVELPDTWSPNDCGDWAYWADAVDSAIEAAGVRIKE